MTNRKFYRSVFTYEILSEEPIGDVSLRQAAWLTSEGPCSGRFLRLPADVTDEEIGRTTAAGLLLEHGSDCSFFGLDEHGNDADDADDEGDKGW